MSLADDLRRAEHQLHELEKRHAALMAEMDEVIQQRDKEVARRKAVERMQGQLNRFLASSPGGYAFAAPDSSPAKKVVWVEWSDSEAMLRNWVAKDEFDTFARDSIAASVSAGLLWADEPHHITLVQNVSADCVSGHIKIPRAAILHIETIGEVGVPPGEEEGE